MGASEFKTTPLQSCQADFRARTVAEVLTVHPRYARAECPW